MTSSTAAISNDVPAAAAAARVVRQPVARTTSRRPARGRAFTLVEMLVVTGIIVSMLAILLPAVGVAWRKGVRARMQLDLQTITVGLEAYKADHNTYPIVYGSASSPVTAFGAVQTGAVVLGRCMVGPTADDGSDPGATTSDMSPGFRVKPKINDIPQGRTYGPYVPPERFRTGASFELLDRNKKPILYYPGRPGANINVLTSGYMKQTPYGNSNAQPMFNGNDNHSLMITGDLQNVLGDTNKNGAIDPTEGAAYTGSFLLWSAGPDEKFGAKDPNKPISPRNRCDDVANFDRSEY